MANKDRVAQILKGWPNWNAWRGENVHTRPDLSKADLRGASELSRANLKDADLTGADLRGVFLFEANFGHADLSGADLRKADLSGASFCVADLSRADLTGANLTMADFVFAKVTGAKLKGASLGGADLSSVDLDGLDLSGAFLRRARLCDAKLVGARLVETDLNAADLCQTDFRQADLSGADLSGANLRQANLSGANLRGANLSNAILVSTDLTDADLTGCLIHGVSAWKLKLDRAKQQNLVITGEGEPKITVDNIEVAQFIYLMLHNQKVRDVIDTITSKVVLILGRFTEERKAVLDALREELRKRNYLPILFDFEKSANLDTDETITLLARMARFIIADISDAKAVLQELRAIVPDLPSVPVQPIILATQEEPGMFDFYRNRPSFLSVHRYATQKQLLVDLEVMVIRPAELKLRELRELRADPNAPTAPRGRITLGRFWHETDMA